MCIHLCMNCMHVGNVRKQTAEDEQQLFQIVRLQTALTFQLI